MSKKRKELMKELVTKHLGLGAIPDDCWPDDSDELFADKGMSDEEYKLMWEKTAPDMRAALPMLFMQAELLVAANGGKAVDPRKR